MENKEKEINRNYSTNPNSKQTFKNETLNMPTLAIVQKIHIFRTKPLNPASEEDALGKE